MALPEVPAFWWREPGLRALLLSPLSLLWGLASAWRMELAPTAQVGVPVLCVGNFVSGGAGKTPTAIAICRAARKAGMKPGFLSRGYGGRIAGPVRVDPSRHGAHDVGDEPLLLAAEAVTVVSSNRPAGAARLVAEGCDFIIMDDGFQNPKLAKDFSIAVVDARRGVGNGFTMPAGPLRAPLARQMALADAIIVVGNSGRGDEVIREAARRARPVYLARTVPAGRSSWKRKPYLAYAGIADPSKLFSSLEECGADLVETRHFPDHHFYTDEEVEDLLADAYEKGLSLVTTAKDMVRLQGGGELQQRLADGSQVFAIDMKFEDPRTLTLILEATKSKAEARRLRRNAGRKSG